MIDLEEQAGCGQRHSGQVGLGCMRKVTEQASRGKHTIGKCSFIASALASLSDRLMETYKPLPSQMENKVLVNRNCYGDVNKH